MPNNTACIMPVTIVYMIICIILFVSAKYTLPPTIHLERTIPICISSVKTICLALKCWDYIKISTYVNIELNLLKGQPSNNLFSRSVRFGSWMFWERFVFMKNLRTKNYTPPTQMGLHYKVDACKVYIKNRIAVLVNLTL